ncbi:hypothetical protein JRQ81_000956 [Phrynocephalus forsythii]|uniref:SGNH hydrolase-type esterase domain-containing protein n=1 Tax=Phrynocephalus forsythii TaxID=171643 RepID=A0A9Q0Y7K1_9SAUR|nr:hypothetical protein JRQ81_000956 [Phrynocephalus forsythii]
MKQNLSCAYSVFLIISVAAVACGPNQDYISNVSAEPEQFTLVSDLKSSHVWICLSSNDGIDGSDSNSSNTRSAVMRLWIVGHSIVYWAGVWAKQSHWGQHLGMEEHVCITWFGNRGMHWGDLLPGLWTLFRRHGAPHGLVIQLGENNITSSRGIDLKKEMEASLLVLHSTYPDVTLFWSQLLQRRHWRGARHPGRVELLRRKLDKAIGRLITTWGESG